MSVYLGSYGYVELQRKSGRGNKASSIEPSDINVSRRRFSFDFETGFLVSGDRIEITSTDGSVLEFMPASAWNVGVKQSSGSWYVHIDEIGGVRLYATFDDALGGETTTAYALEAIVTAIPVTVSIANDIPSILAQCSYFELNTNREVVDVTVLGDEFRNQFSGLITGSGSFRAFWDYLPLYTKSGPGETANYLLQLAIRTEVGSEFSARLYLKAARSGESGSPLAVDDEIWYEFDAVISQAGVNFSPENAVEITADFITTGPIRLRAKTAPTDKILQENEDDIRLEQDATASLLQETAQ